MPARSVKNAASAPKPRAPAPLLPKNATYAQKAAVLRDLGYRPAYGKRGGSLPHRKAALTRQVNALAAYLGPKSHFKFIPAPAGVRTRSVAPGHQATPAGVFVQIPRNIERKNFRARVTKSGELVTTIKGENGAGRKDRIVPLSPEAIARNPDQAIASILGQTIKIRTVRKAGKRKGRKAKGGRRKAKTRTTTKTRKPVQVQLLVNGHEAARTYDIKDFFKKGMSGKRLTEKGGFKTRDKGAKKSRNMTPEEIAATFSIKLIYDTDPDAPEPEEEDEWSVQDEDAEDDIS